MRILSVFGVLAIAVCGCAFTQSLERKPHAMLNDVAVKPRHESGYEVVAIDEAPVQRRQSHLTKVEPFALVTPGIHKLTLAPKTNADSNLKPTTISAAFEAGMRYRIKVDDNSVYVVDDD